VSLRPLLCFVVLCSVASGLWSSPARADVPWLRGLSRGEDLAIHVVTFGPGDDIAEWFGHAAIAVEDTRLKEARLYNYGEYAFDKTVALRYLRGHLIFHVGERPFVPTLDLYAAHRRDVRTRCRAGGRAWCRPLERSPSTAADRKKK
jgi:hypothetical protein